MLDVAAPPRSFRNKVRTLRQFDGPRCLWRVPVSLGTYVLIRGLPVIAAVVIALVTVDGRVAGAMVSATIALAFDAAGKRMRERIPWDAAVARRLQSYELPNPRSEVPVLLRADDCDRARVALRAARFSPQYVTRLGSPPEDAPELQHKLVVHEPEAWPQSSSDEDRVRRIAELVERGGIRARVAALDVAPSDGRDGRRLR